ncbi:hypothetical protein [Chamaesiphon sp.]|uniref:hypothetical protein n=1 Tax=Chamaesiphon sp. TaxID=2814140 RepID=UPI003593CBFD
MGLTLAQIDRLLLEWQQKGDAANQNLLDLYDLSAYQRLSGMGNPPRNVTGITQQQASTALTALDRLFEYLELFNHQLDRVQKLRRELPSLFISDLQLDAIEHLLVGTSIDLPNLQIPLAQRDLSGANYQNRSVSLPELMERMTIAFAIARDTFVEMETAWTELESKLIDTHRSLIELQQLAQNNRVALPASLLTAQTNFANLQLEIDRDPLGINRTFTQEWTPLIANIRHEVTTVAQQYQQLQSDFTTAKSSLDRLYQLDRDSLDSATASQSKIVHGLPIASPLPAEELVELARWLERLAVKFESGMIAPVRVGLTNWMSKVRAYTIVAEATAIANHQPLATRQELRGRLDALTAKALAKGQAEDPVLVDLATEARQVLYSSPTDLNLAIDLVRKYERQLNHRLAC